VADSYNNLGVIYWQIKQLDKSIECYQESREIYRNKNVNFARGLATCTGNIAEAYREKGDLKEAEKYHLEAIEMARQIPDRQVECHQYHGLGEIYIANGDYKTALEFLERALTLAKELNDQEAMGDACKGICEVHQKTDRLEEALKFFDCASRHYNEIGAEAKLKKLWEIKAELAVS
jgi:tetratricopeptide (TPR) repeat protein